MSYNVKTYDFHDAISHRHENVIIEHVEHVSDTMAIVRTNNGTFICKSWEDFAGDVWLSVSSDCGDYCEENNAD